MLNSVDFLSKSCKTDTHNTCHGLWRGLNIEARCYCECHKKKEGALELVGKLGSSAIHRAIILPGEASRDECYE